VNKIGNKKRAKQISFEFSQLFLDFPDFHYGWNFIKMEENNNKYHKVVVLVYEGKMRKTVKSRPHLPAYGNPQQS